MFKNWVESVQILDTINIDSVYSIVVSKRYRGGINVDVWYNNMPQDADSHVLRFQVINPIGANSLYSMRENEISSHVPKEFYPYVIDLLKEYGETYQPQKV